MDQRVLDGVDRSGRLPSLLSLAVHRLAGSFVAQNSGPVTQLRGYSHQLSRQSRHPSAAHQGVTTEAVQKRQLIRSQQVCLCLSYNYFTSLHFT